MENLNSKEKKHLVGTLLDISDTTCRKETPTMIKIMIARLFSRFGLYFRESEKLPMYFFSMWPKQLCYCFYEKSEMHYGYPLIHSDYFLGLIDILYKVLFEPFIRAPKATLYVYSI